MARFSFWINLCGALLLLGFSSVALAQARSEPTKEQFGLPSQYAATAFADVGSMAGRSFGVSVHVTDLTSNGETEELAATLKSKGPDKLISVLEDMKDKGRVAPMGTVGTGVSVVRIRPTKNGGQHIVLLTNRPITFPELYAGTRSRDYPFGILVLDVDREGKGTGLLAPLCKIRFNKKNELEIENYDQKPFRLANVYREK